MAPTLYDEKPQPGDLIEIFRGSFQHWAVYVGDGFVVHLVPPPEVPGAGALADKAIVKKEKLWDVVETDRWEINNTLDEKYEPRPVRVIVKEACALVDKILPYSLIGSNCEHFVNELRYGKSESRQVHEAIKQVMASGLTGMVVLGVFALFGGSKIKNNKTKNKK